jgi:hypothetical protein
MRNPAAEAILLLSALAGRTTPSLPERPNISAIRSDPTDAAGIQDPALPIRGEPGDERDM